MTKQRPKKAGLAETVTADYSNDLEPPVQLGIMGPRAGRVSQSQTAVSDHFIKHWFSLGTAHRGPLFDFYFPVLNF